MSNHTLDNNPYAVTSIEPADATAPSSNDWLLCVNNRTNIGGRLWHPCRQMVYADRIELKFLMQSYTLPLAKIRQLRSGGKGMGRHLELIHDDDLAPETIHFLPLYPAKWYDTLEALGIDTEDETELRQSKQWHRRSSEWVSNAESLFWACWIGLIITVPVILGVVKFFQKLF